MGPVPKKIFYAVTILLAAMFASLVIQMNQADTKDVPVWGAGALIVGFLSYSLLFVSRAAYASLVSIGLVIYMFIFSSN